jgi:hypothetical protein
MFHFNGKQLIVGDFSKILLIGDKEIIFEFKRYDLVINGDNIIMPYLEDKEAGIKGIIKSINFKYKMVNKHDL